MREGALSSDAMTHVFACVSEQTIWNSLPVLSSSVTAYLFLHDTLCMLTSLTSASWYISCTSVNTT